MAGERTPDAAPDMLVILTTGKQDRGTRATLAFSWACAALAMGREVAVYLTMDGTVWAMKDSERDVQVAGFEPLASYIEQFFDLGGRLLVCAPCTEFYCSVDQRLTGQVLRPEIRLVGLASVVGYVGDRTSTVTF